MDNILRGLLAGTKSRAPQPAAKPLSKSGSHGISGGRALPASGVIGHTAKPPKQSSDDDASSSAEESDDEVELIAGRGTSSSKTSASAVTEAARSSTAAAESQRVDGVRAFRKRLGISVSGSGSVPDPFEHFYSIPEELPSGMLEQVASSSCVRFQPAPAAASEPPSASAGGKPGSVTKQKKGPLPPVSAPAASAPLAQVAEAVAARHAAVRRAVLRTIEDSEFAEPLPVQMQALPVLLGGRDAMVIAPTGSGKTAAFGLPLILSLQGHVPCGPRVLIVTPTKDLASQTQRELTRLSAGTGIRVEVLTRARAEAASGGHVCATVDAADLRTVVAPALPRADILISTPLLLVTILRHAAATATAASASPAIGPVHGAPARGDTKRVEHSSADDSDGASDSDSGSDSGGGAPSPSLPRVIIPSLRAVVLDEADKLLELGFLEQVDAVFDARPDRAALQTFVEEEAREVAERRKAASASAPASAGGIASAGGALAPAVLDDREKTLRILAGAAGITVPPVTLTESARAAASATTSPGTLPPALPFRVRCAMFSATMPSGIEQLAMTVLWDPLRITVGTKGGGASSSVAQKLVFVGREDGKLFTLKQMVAQGITPPVLVFVQSKERAVQLHRALLVEGLSADAIHADKTPEQRSEAIARFRRGDTWMLVTTDLLGRGMDFPAVKLVVNFDFPTSAVAYIHRIGRTGRGGRTGEAVTFFTEADAPALRSIANVMALSGCAVPPWMLQLRKMGRSERKRLEKRPAKRGTIFKARTKFDAQQSRKAAAAAAGAPGKKR